MSLVKPAYAPTSKLSSVNCGNAHDVVNYLNKFGLADFFVSYSGSGGNGTVILRLPLDWPVDGHGPLPAPGYPIKAAPKVDALPMSTFE